MRGVSFSKNVQKAAQRSGWYVASHYICKKNAAKTYSPFHCVRLLGGNLVVCLLTRKLRHFFAPAQLKQDLLRKQSLLLKSHLWDALFMTAQIIFSFSMDAIFYSLP